MAFTRKSSKSAPPKSGPASYARKKMKEEEVEEVIEEVEEVEEVEEQEEVQDYAEAPRQTRSNTSSGRTSGNNNGGNGNYAPRTSNRAPQGRAPQGRPNSDPDRKALRLTGLFAGKREGLFSGRLRDEDAENLKNLIEEAQGSGQQITFFVWENQGNPQFSLTANIAAPKPFGGGQGQGGFKKRW